MTFTYPILSALTLAAISPPTPRRVERAQSTAAASKIAGAANAQYQRSRGPVGQEQAPAGETRAEANGPEPLLSDGMVATLNAIHGADAEVIAHAMLQAAKAHGPVEGARLTQIIQHLHDAGASEADHDFVMTHLTGPPDIGDVVAHVHDQETAIEAYVVSTLMIDPEVPHEDAYLAELERRLKLSPESLRAIGLKPHTP
jgi:uncharacterized membrane protein YebE (DUF533 family)